MDVLTLIGIVAALVGIVAGVTQVFDYLQQRRDKPSGSLGESTMEQKPLVHLRQILTDRFDASELQNLCFDLGLDYEALPGQSKTDKARELIEHLERRDRIPELIARGEQQRPDISWPMMPSKTHPTDRPYNNLPQPDYGTFIGRKDELAHIHRLLRPYPHSQMHLVTIDGIGGIGKSALALEVARRYLHDYDRLPQEERFEAIIWASAKSTVLTADGILLRHQVTRTLEDIYSTVALTLEREDITQAPPEDQNELVCKALTQQRTLLIVDNLETVDDESVNIFLRELPAPAKAIVTTRHRVDVAYPVRLTGMSQEDGLALIDQECSKKGATLTEAEAEKLNDRTGGVPLAIVWSVAQIGFGYGVEATLRRLGQPTDDISRFCFQEVMERIRDTDAHKLLVALSLFATDASREAIGHAAGLGEDILSRDEGLVTLGKWSLVNKRADRFSLLPLTRSYLSHEAQRTPRFVQITLERMVDYYERLVVPPGGILTDVRYWHGLANHSRVKSLEKEWRNLNYLVRWTLDKGRDAIALNLFLPIVHLLHVWGLWDERLELSYEMCRAAQRLQDSAAVWLWIDSVGYILRQRRQFSEALQALKKGKTLASQHGLDEALTLAKVYEACLKRKMGEIDSAQEQLDRALKRLDPASALAHGTPIQRIVARRAATEAAALSRSREDFLSGKKWHEVELELRRSVNENEVPALSSLAHMSIKLGDVASAKKYLSDMPTNLGKKDEAWNYYEWALVAEKEGDWQEVRRLATLALEQFTRLAYVTGIQFCQELLDRSRSTQ